MLTYSGEKVTAMFGPVIAKALADGENAVEIQFDGDGVTVKTGISGETGVSKSAVRSGKIIWRLMAGCPEDKALALLQKTGVGMPAGVVDLSSGESYVTTKGFLQKPPNGAFGQTIGTREWTIVCPALERVL